MLRRSFLWGAGGAAFGSALTAWSAEGTLGRIAYVQQDGLWIRSLPRGKPERLVSGIGLDLPRFSPSGKWIAYFQESVLHVVSAGGGYGIGLGTPDRCDSGALWRPDGGELLANGPAGLRVFTPANGWGKPIREIRNASLPIVFSPDGKEIIYGDAVNSGRVPGGVPRTGRLCRVKLDGTGGEPKVLVSKPYSGLFPCAWSGGDQVLYWDDPDFSASFAADGLELFRTPAAGGTPQSMGVSTLVHYDMLALSPEKTRMTVSAGNGRYEWEGKRIAIIDLNTVAISYLTDASLSSVCPAWSPRGDRIAFAAAPSPPSGAEVGGGRPAKRLLDRRRIWIGGVAAAEAPRRLTNDDFYRDEEPMWSGDGRSILFGRIDSGNERTLWLTDVEGGRPIQVAGPLYARTGLTGADEGWFGYYGYIDWRRMMDWHRGAA
ncbi:MAG TPA: hypothetical protein VGZ73_06390 [Bryobacteraceae bacterium]|nr:hypothetical protein [Bryobacteraceae bacterium]